MVLYLFQSKWNNKTTSSTKTNLIHMLHWPGLSIGFVFLSRRSETNSVISEIIDRVEFADEDIPQNP